MAGAMRFIKTTLIGGLFVVLPVILLYLLALKAIQLAVKISTPIAAVVPAELSPVKSPLLIAVVLIVGASFLVGLAMRSRLARRYGHWVEAQTLGRLGPYKFVKGLTGSIGDSSADAAFRPALLTHPNGAKVFALIVEEHGDGTTIVFLPSAPTPTVGTVQIAERRQLQILDLRGREVLQSLSQWGMGASRLLEKAQATPARKPEEVSP